MDTIGPSPFCWLEFDANGGLVDAGAPAAIEAMLNAPGITDVVVMSHGWNNTKTDAMTLYGTLWRNVAAALGHRTRRRSRSSGSSGRRSNSRPTSTTLRPSRAPPGNAIGRRR